MPDTIILEPIMAWAWCEQHFLLLLPTLCLLEEQSMADCITAGGKGHRQMSVGSYQKNFNGG